MNKLSKADCKTYFISSTHNLYISLLIIIIVAIDFCCEAILMHVRPDWYHCTTQKGWKIRQVLCHDRAWLNIGTLSGLNPAKIICNYTVTSLILGSVVKYTTTSYYNTVIYSTYSVITQLQARLPLPILPISKTVIITLFCYNTDSTMDSKNSIIMRFQCSNITE